MIPFQKPLPVLILLLAASLAVAANPAPAPDQLLSAGRADDAIQVLKSRLEAAPDDAEAFHLLTRAYYYMGRWDDAIAAAERAVALKPDSSDYHLWLGRAYGMKAEHSSFLTAARMTGKIRGAFEKAVALDASSVGARSDLAEFYLEAPPFLGGGKDKALAQAEQLSMQDPASAHWIKGQLAEKAKRFDLAEKEYRAAIKVSKSPASRWLDLAAFYRARGRLSQMDEAIDHAVYAEKRRDDNVLFDAANLLFTAGKNFPAAIQFLKRYLASDAKTEEAPAYQAHYLLGTILEKQGDRQAAAAEYRAALSLARDFQEAREALKRVSP